MPIFEGFPREWSSNDSEIIKIQKHKNMDFHACQCYVFSSQPVLYVTGTGWSCMQCGNLRNDSGHVVWRLNQSASFCILLSVFRNSAFYRQPTTRGLMVHADTRKGVVYIYQSEDNLMHFCWRERSKSTAEDVNSRVWFCLMFVFKTVYV